MEEIYKPEHFNSTEHINLEEYFEKYREKLFKVKTANIKSEVKLHSFLRSLGDFSDDQLEDLNKNCSVDRLEVKGEMKQKSLDNVINTKALAYFHIPGEINDDSRKLHTVREVEKRLGDAYKNRLLLSSLRDRMFHTKVNRPQGTGFPDLEPENNFLVIIRFFRSFVYHFSDHLPSKSVRFDQEITLLGSNTLADLKDKIKCSSDVAILTDVSENPQNIKNLQSSKEIYPSGFFYIDNVFYNDFRQNNAKDYSEIVRKWAEDKKIGNFETSEMDKTQIKSLKPRFGYPYVYQHQGRCEHILIFSYARILNNEDVLHSDCYPYHSDIASGKSVYCFICSKSLPVWLVKECDRMPQNNTLLCNACFTSYCYVNNKKVGKFQAYPYVHRNALF